MRFNVVQGSRGRSIFVAAAGIGLVSVAVAAAMPSEDGTITGCTHNTTGALRIIAPATETCRSQEREVVWKDGINGSVDADTLDGLEATDLQEICPANFSKFRDLCVGESRVGTWTVGYYACLNEGSRLPDTGEAGLIALFLHLAPGEMPVDEFWTSDRTEAGKAILGETTPPSFYDTAETALSTGAHFRCVASPRQPEVSAAASAFRAGAEGSEEPLVAQP